MLPHFNLTISSNRYYYHHFRDKTEVWEVMNLLEVIALVF